MWEVLKRWGAVFLVLAVGFGACPTEQGSVDGGVICAGCSFGMGLADQLAQTYNESIAQSLERICDYLPEGNFTVACKELVDFFGPIIIDLWYMKETPDVICQLLRLCYIEPGHQECHLFPLPKEGLLRRASKHRDYADIYLWKRKAQFDLPEDASGCDLPGIRILCYIYDRFFNHHEPVVDLDGDMFSTIEALRGTDWRGKDCNDLNKDYHPGAKPINSDINYDSNCNGIYGVDEHGTPYEDLFCKDSKPLGIVTLGDSAAAHFHIPVEWLIVKHLSKETLAHLPNVVENEFDWPMMSGTTGFKNVTWPIISGPVHSAYQRMRQRNRCMHRDYQNIGVNGADSFDMQRNQNTMARNVDTDLPVLLSYQLVGNDVCNHYPDTVAHMTTPRQMWDNVVHTLTFLETRLPRGSHVLLMGLADGRILYDHLYERFHPIGTQNRDVTYPDFYDFLTCLEICPCTGWMNTNETLRNLTSERAEELSRVLSRVAKKYRHTFSNFEVEYIDCPFKEVLNQWEKDHGPGTAYQLIEPVDGFHPNQMAQTLTAELVEKYLAKHLPHYLGDTNPFNQKIQDIFGDQGGY